MGTTAAFGATIVKATPFLSGDECQAYGVWMTYPTACAFRKTSARAFWLPDKEYQGILLPDDECQGIWCPVERLHSIFLPDNEYQGILPFGHRVSGHISFR